MGKSTARDPDATAPNARVTFRRRVMATPTTLEIAPSSIVELIEVSAPGHQTVRYWLTFDRPTQLTAQLVRGAGSFEATEEQALIALGEVSAPAVAQVKVTAKPAAAAPAPAAKIVEKTVAVAPAVVAPVVVASAPVVVPARKIGRAAAEAAPEAPEVAKPTMAEITAAMTLELGKLEPPPEPEPVTAQAPPPAAVAVPVPVPVQVTPPRPAFDNATVGAIVAKNRPAVLKCFAAGKKQNANMKGSLQLQLQVEPSGKVKRAQVQSTLNNSLVAACVMRSANGWRFPVRADGKLAMVNYPFTIN